MYQGDEVGCVPSSIFACFSVTDNSVANSYINYQLSANLHGRWLSRFTTIGARANGSLNVDDNDLLALPVPLPEGPAKFAEQQKIADCLSSLDALISAETDKLAALRDHKKGLMQQLFPAKGETTPRLRFLSDGEWTPESLPDVAFFQEGPGIMAVDFCDEGVPLVRLSGVSGTSVTLNGCNYLDRSKVSQKWAHFRLEPKDLVISTSATFGLVSTVTDVAAGAVFYTGLIRFRPHDERLHDGYLKAFLGSEPFARQVEAAAVGGGIKHFGPTHLKQMEISIPPMAEQMLIAECLTSCDDVIDAQMRRLDAIFAHKSGLMQQLFPSPTGATA
jgi:type I restriction enzyme S subunit